jgi:hypothetical protein
MSKKSQSNHQPSTTGQPAWLWLAVAGALLLIAAGLAFWWTSASPSPAAAPPQTNEGGPRLAIDRASVDEGQVKLDTPVRTTFRLSNVGGQALQIIGEPQVELIEGC